MASQFPPKKNTAFTLYFTLYKSDGTVIANPGTITKKYSIDGATVGDLSNAITEEDTTYGQCSIVITSGEMNGDAIWIYIKDDTTGCVPFTCTLYTAAETLDEVKADTAAILADTGTDGVVVAAASKTGYALSAAGVQAIWDALTSALTTVGSIGKRLVDYLTGDAYARLGAPAGASVSADIAAVKVDTAATLEDTGTTLPATLTTIDNFIDTEIADIHDTLDLVHTDVDAILADTNELQTDWKNGGRLDLLLDRAADGAGAITWTYTITDGTDPLEGVDVWVTSDVGGATVLARGTTNASGVVTFYLDAGTVYVWSQKSGYTFTNPDTEVVS